MLIIFVPLLAALGAAFVLQGHEVRGLLVALTADAVVGIGAAACGRWPWVAFALALGGVCLAGIAAARR